MSWGRALLQERWRRCGVLAALGGVLGLSLRGAPLGLPLLVAIAAFMSLSEGMASWLAEARSARLAYYRAWGVGVGALRLGVSGAALVPVALLIGVLLGVQGGAGKVALGAAAVAAALGLVLAVLAWPLARERAWLATVLPMLYGALAGLVAALANGGGVTALFPPGV